MVSEETSSLLYTSESYIAHTTEQKSNASSTVATTIFNPSGLPTQDVTNLSLTSAPNTKYCCCECMHLEKNSVVKVQCPLGPFSSLRHECKPTTAQAAFMRTQADDVLQSPGEDYAPSVYATTRKVMPATTADRQETSATPILEEYSENEEELRYLYEMLTIEEKYQVGFDMNEIIFDCKFSGRKCSHRYGIF